MKKILIYFFAYFLYTLVVILGGHYLVAGFLDGFNSEGIVINSIKFALIAAPILSFYLTYLELRKEIS